MEFYLKPFEFKEKKISTIIKCQLLTNSDFPPAIPCRSPRNQRSLRQSAFPCTPHVVALTMHAQITHAIHGQGEKRGNNTVKAFTSIHGDMSSSLRR